MTYNFFLVSKEDAKDGTRIGYAYAVANKDKWVNVDSASIRDYLTIGFVKGCDFVVSDGKVYSIMKTYTDLDDKSTVFICVESISGCDNKKVFNNLDRSSIIVNKKATPTIEGEDEEPGT